MALLRRRSDSPDSSKAAPHAVHLHYAIGSRKVDLDHFVHVRELLDARLKRLGVGHVEAHDLRATEGTLLLQGADCARIWDAAERAVLLCPLTPDAVELRSGEPGAPTVRFPVPESVQVALRPRLELAASGTIAQRRISAFDVLLRLEQLRDGDWLTLAEVGDERHAVRCEVQGTDWVVDHVRLPTSDAAFDALVEWAS